MRGALALKPPIAGPARIIPAYAGSTNGQIERYRAGGDHPRVCGEHFGGHDACSMSAGSSPRMRGAQGVAERLGGGVGIIPAYAGSTDRLDVG